MSLCYIFAMTTLAIIQKPSARKITVEVNLDQWEKLADTFGFYKPEFIKTLKQSIKESRAGRVRKIESLKDLEK